MFAGGKLRFGPPPFGVEARPSGLRIPAFIFPSNLLLLPLCGLLRKALGARAKVLPLDGQPCLVGLSSAKAFLENSNAGLLPSEFLQTKVELGAHRLEGVRGELDFGFPLVLFGSGLCEVFAKFTLSSPEGGSLFVQTGSLGPEHAPSLGGAAGLLIYLAEFFS